MKRTVKMRIGRALNVFGLRNLARTMEKAISPKRFRAADRHTPSAVEKALTIAERKGLTYQGDYYEFGLYRGYTFWYAQKVMTECGNRSIRFIGFDSFAGLPAVEDIDNYKCDFAKGQYEASLTDVRTSLNHYGVDWKRTILIPGYFEHILTPGLKTKYQLRPAAVTLIDSDLYKSAAAVLTFIGDMLLDESILIFDDWNAFDQDNAKGERRAFQEFCDANPQWTAKPLFAYGTYGQTFTIHKREAKYHKIA